MVVRTIVNNAKIIDTSTGKITGPIFRDWKRRGNPNREEGEVGRGGYQNGRQYSNGCYRKGS